MQLFGILSGTYLMRNGRINPEGKQYPESDGGKTHLHA